MKTTIKKKNDLIFFDQIKGEGDWYDIRLRFKDDLDAPSPCDGHSFIVWMGGKEVAVVSYFQRENELILTQLYVFPEFRGCGVGTTVIEALSTEESVHIIRVIATESSESFYKAKGFESDLGHTILTKVVL